jgi:hypothetical protein
MFMRFVAAAVILVVLAVPAAADEAKPADKPSQPSEAVLAFGIGHPDCQEWSDGCVICARGEDVVNCSTPGIACQPVESLCRRPPK